MPETSPAKPTKSFDGRSSLELVYVRTNFLTSGPKPCWPPMEACVNNIISVSWILRDNAWDITGKTHQVIWWAIQPGTCICWDQFSDIWSQTSLAHHWIGLNRSWHLGPNCAMYWVVPSILWTSNLDTVSANRQWLMMDWTLTLIFGRGATVKSWTAFQWNRIPVWGSVPISRGWWSIPGDTALSWLAAHGNSPSLPIDQINV